mmetsp:Transcript_8221/g.10582  ORF Transcript_8221/g.10582 Transcript_8221/m.10582 type:complete len:536 (-) Transcript_8221:286-1893(-)|eukprot:CAMPEP_0116069390 /NCGR_PEP_ID=MMETSP0322-20121206/12268_1 /TAXON_ID=163516 /ORGANISM="Leptocylindrus danicus var. apora, Strain B651" /LENGTH=535 /DNA_ID=CAMNT_0003556763 /DNA_START=168 /DNA_END=1775 /DNA_ORIENTATION=-
MKFQRMPEILALLLLFGIEDGCYSFSSTARGRTRAQSKVRFTQTPSQLQNTFWNSNFHPGGVPFTRAAATATRLHVYFLNDEDDNADSSSSSKSKEAARIQALLTDQVINPLLSEEIEKNVPKSTIQGAALAGTALGLVTGTGLLGAGTLALSAAYAAIAPGKNNIGSVMRSVGSVAWDAVELSDKLGLNVENVKGLLYATANVVRESSQGEGGNVKVDLALYRTFVESFREYKNSNAMDDDDAGLEEALAEAEAALRIVELQKEAMEEVVGATAVDEEVEDKYAQIAEQQREKDIMEERRKREEAKYAQEQAEKKKANAEAREAARIAAEEEEAVRIAAEKEEAARIAAEEEEAARIAAEEEKEEARLLAEFKEATAVKVEEQLEVDSMTQLPGESEDEYYARMAEKARLAVTQQEDLANARQTFENAFDDDDEIEDDDDLFYDDDDDVDVEDSVFFDQNGEQVNGDQLWDASVKLAQDLDGDVKVLESESEETTVKDWSSFTVVQLKDELRSRGLKVSGRKAELIDRLVEYEA